MHDSLQARTAERVRRLVDAGYPDAEPAEAGVAGAVYRLGAGMVAKLWDHRRVSDLLRMQRFYVDAAADLPFATPEIVAVSDIDGVPVTVERELDGEPLNTRVSPEDIERSAGCVVEVLRGLGAVADAEYLRRLPVLDEDRPLWEGHENFVEAFTDLLERRVDRSADLLGTHVDDFGRKNTRLVERLRALDGEPPVLVHGDLFPEIILVDGDLRPTAVTDFGFLSTAGDPRLDAAISAAIFDMGTEHARQTADALTARFADELGYTVEDLLLYRAAYALVTSCGFAPDFVDEHLAWCTSVLNDPAVADALGV